VRRYNRFALGCLCFIVAAIDCRAGESAVIVRPENKISVDSFRIVLGTESIFLNNHRLVRGADYSIDRIPPILTLLNFQPGDHDTLTLTYTKWPHWFLQTWGRPLGELSAPSSKIPTPRQAETAVHPAQGGAIRISGAKSFRVTSGPGVGSAFGQSLDLGISGELAPGVQLSGAISDRGYDPINGFANSRLDEYDRLYLRLTSPRLVAQAGDISTKDLAPSVRSRDVSGGSVQLRFPTYSLFGIAARPRGRFQSIRLNGRDGYQGPYQPTGAVRAIVPGSEQVWLDGRLLERGANKDYTVDYPTGRITIGPAHPVDARSRIEIDYEPVTTQYRQELLVVGGGITSRDSSRTLAVTLTREGDDRERSLTVLNPEDQNALANSSDTLIARSGVTADSLGAFRMIADSLPDTVWQYVGIGNGDHTVRFSFVGANKGRYRYLGNDQYLFTGSSRGDYEPIILLTPARRTETFQAVGTIRPVTGGRIDADVRISSAHFNLWNPGIPTVNGSYHSISARQNWNWHGTENWLRISRQYVDAAYASSVRLDEPDLSRTYLTPGVMTFSGHRTRHDASLDLSLVRNLVVHPLFSRLDYSHLFSSNAFGTTVDWKLRPRLTVNAGWREVAANYRLSPRSGEGAGTSIFGRGAYAMGRYSLTSEIEYDRRRNEYGDSATGVRYRRESVSLLRDRNSISYERYREDSLVSSWRRNLTRHRLNATVEQSFGLWRADGLFTRQWLDFPDRNERSLLGRVNVGHDDPRRRLALAAGYTISEEQRNARGYTYLQVDPGRGNYRLDNGRYIADPFGDYLRIEELLSDIQRVRRGERTFRFSKESRDFLIRGSSFINEELMIGGKRPWWWAIPFASSESAPYLFYERRYEIESRAVSWQGVHLLNLSAADTRESRLIVDQSRVRRDFRLRVAVREPLKRWSLEQGAERFTSDRDQFYGDAGRAEGWRGFVGAKRTIEGGEISSELEYRRADGNSGDPAAAERSTLIILKSGIRAAVLHRGELRLDTETYTQALLGIQGYPSSILTDNHEGKRGVVWTVSANYGLSRTLRLNMTINGRYSDNRPGRLFARSEMTAEF
jgi:hypothetical protein